MESKLDLDINNYTIKDLELFFRLNPAQKYSVSDVELKECEIREQLLSSGHINKRFKKELIDFLNTAKKWILLVKFDKNEITPSSIPKNYKLETYDYPISKKEPTSREVDLIQRAETQFIHTKSDDFFPGSLNPLNTRVITKCVTIDTRFRDNLYSSQSSDFILQLPFKLNKVVSMQLASIELPISFYGISANYGNNYFYISVIQREECECHEPYTTKIVIPDGNYNAADLIKKINDLLHSNTVDLFQSVLFTLDISETGSGTGKIIVEPIGLYKEAIHEIILDFSKDFDGNFSNGTIATKIGWNLGFIKPIYQGSVRYVSDTLIEPASIRYVYLAIDDYNNCVNNNFVSAFNKSVLDSNILARISIKATYFSLVMENDLNIVTEPRKYFGPVDIQRLRIRLFDEHGRVIEMNHANFSFCLNFKLMYDL